MELTNKLGAILGISGVATYAGHEYLHQMLSGGAASFTEIQSVTFGLGILAFAGILLNEIGLRGEVDTEGDLLPVVLIGATSLSVFHEVTHGSLGGGILELGLSQTSYWLAGFSVVGVLIHERVVEMM